MSKREPRYHPGQKIGGRYLVHQALMGGMGEVYLCLDEQEMHPYALKTFQGNNSTLRTVFEREVSTWVALEKHPNIVRCFQMVTFDNLPFMVLEWIAGNEKQGIDLRGWLRNGPLNLRLALRFTIDICWGLQHAGEKVPGIVHRDLKPDNILVDQSQCAKVTDFGLATVVQQAGLNLDAEASEGKAFQQSCYVGNIVGTPLYMSPEQWRGDARIDARTDIYAVGCILYELLTGHEVYSSTTLSELQRQHLEAPIPSLNSFPAEVAPILKRCLAKQREERFEHFDLLLAELNRVYETHFGKKLRRPIAGELTVSDYNNRGITYDNLGQSQRAIADFDHAIQLDPECVQAYYNRGGIYVDWGQYQRAIADYDRAIVLDPGDAEIYSNRGLSYAAWGQRQRAIADYNRAIELDPCYAYAYYNRGVSYAALGQREQAIADYNHAIEIDPNYARAYLNRGVCYAVLGQREQAIADYARAIEIDPVYLHAYLNRANEYIALGQHQRAIADYNRAIELDPSLAQTYCERGNAYADLGQHAQAVADYTRAIEINPGGAHFYYNRGISYVDLGQFQRAIADFDRAIEIHPDFILAYCNRGNCYAALEQHQKAIINFDHAIRLDPGLAIAYCNRGNSFRDLGQFQRAITDYDRTIELNSNDPASYSSRGDCYKA